MLPLLHAPCHRGYWRSWPSFYSRTFPFLVIFTWSNRAGGARECRPSVYVLAAPTDPAVERPGCVLPRGHSRTVSPPCRVRADYYRRYRSAVLAAKETAADQFRLVHPGAIRRGCLLRSTCTAMRCGEDRYFVWSSHGALAHLIASGVGAHLRCAASESAGAAAASWLVSAPLGRARFNLKSV